MTEATVTIALLGIAVTLLWLCRMSLRYIFGAIESINGEVTKFIHEYREINDFDERLRLGLQVRLDAEQTKSMAGWKSKHPDEIA